MTGMRRRARAGQLIPCAPASPTERLRGARASASTTRCTATGRRRCCCSRRGRSSTRGSGSCRCPTSRGTPGRGLRPSRQRTLGPAGRPVVVRRRRARRRRGCRPGRGRGAGGGRGRSVPGSAGAACPGGRSPGAGARRDVRRRQRRAPRPEPDPIGRRSTRSGRATRAGGAGTRTTGARTRRVRGVLLRRGLPGGPLDPSGRGRGGVGARDRRGDTRRDGSRPGAGCWAPPKRWPRPRGCAAPPSWCTATTTGSPRSPTGWPSPSALGSPLDVVAGGGHCVNARHPVWFNLRLRRFVEQVAGRCAPVSRTSPAPSTTRG